MPRTRSNRVTNIPVESSVCSPNEALTNLVTKEYESHEEFLQEFDTYFNNKITEYQQGYQKAVEYVNKMFSDILEDLPLVPKELNVTKNINEYNATGQKKEPNISTSTAPRSRKSAKSVVESKKPKTSRVGASRTCSMSVSSTPAPYTEDPALHKTPLKSSRMVAPGSTITPKFYSHSPITMMRRPLNGEFAVSMCGSPLMVGAVSREDVPTVNVPMQDGRVFSIIPEPGAPPPDLPNFDEATKNYLKTLRAHLEILAPNTP